MLSTYTRLWLLAALLIGFALPTSPTHAQSGQRCFAEVPYCMSGRIREFWEQNGGLPVFGLPISPEQQATIEGRTFTVQWFERNRLELHPENPRPYDVLLGRLGDDRLQQQSRDWQSFTQSGPQSGCRFFPQTNQNVCGGILRMWQANGLEIDGRAGKSEAESLALFGLPLSPAQNETMADGRTYTVQWFERARFELHPENRAPYDVLLGLLGNEIIEGANPTTAPTQPSAPPATTCNQRSAGACVTPAEAELARLINQYRAANGLPPIALSRSLTNVAQAHVIDLQDNRPNSGTDGRGLACNLHSWSNKGAWSPVCYTDDHAYASGMWSKPREITGLYTDNGFEIALGGSDGYQATPEAALQAWQSSSGHNAVMLQQGTWSRMNWQAMGVGLYGSYAVVWFGVAADPQGVPQG